MLEIQPADTASLRQTIYHGMNKYNGSNTTVGPAYILVSVTLLKWDCR